jgi:uncharacterized membrane protein YoaK (UPF0700 family)
MVTRPLVRTAALSFTAGFVDTCGFIALSGLFAAHITGNFVVLGATLTGDAVGAASKILALPVFLLTICLATVLVRRAQDAGRPVLGRIYFAEAILLGVFLLIGWVKAPFDNPDGLYAILAGIAAVAAMGLQNAAAFLGEPAPIYTTAMTRNAAQAVIDAVDLLRRPDASEDAAERFGPLILALACFVAGALIGAAGFLLADYACLAVPIATILLIQLIAPPDRPAIRSGAGEPRPSRADRI